MYYSIAGACGIDNCDGGMDGGGIGGVACHSKFRASFVWSTVGF